MPSATSDPPTGVHGGRRTPSLPAARISMAATMLFIVLFAALHIIKPELDPSWRVISEYEIGAHGWLMQLAFVCLALGNASLIVAIRPQIRTVAGYIGLFLVLMAAIGLVVAAIFVTPPVTVGKDAWSISDELHGLGAVMAIQSAPLLATLISWALPRRNHQWRAFRPWLWLATTAIWLSFLAFVIAGGTRVDGSHGPGDWYGWANRAFIVAFGIWVIIVAGKAAAISTAASKKQPAEWVDQGVA